MTTANHLINALAGEDKDQAKIAFESMIQDRIADHLEVRKVELASTIMDDLQEGYHDNVPELAGKKVAHDVEYTKKGKTHTGVVHAARSDGHRKAHGVAAVKFGIKTSDITSMSLKEGQGMDAQRRWTRHVSAIGKGYEGGLGHKVSVHRQELKGAARKYFQKMGGVEGGVGAEYVDRGAKFVKDARAAKPNRAPWKGPRKLQGEEAIVEGGPTRKHFQQVADLLKNIPDETKRKELAQHHAGLFKAQNPRFDHKRFFAAAGVNEDTQLDEVLSGGSKPAVASNQQLGRNVMANIRKATQSLGLKVNANLAAQGHKDFAKLVAKNPKAPGYALLRKLAPAKAQAVQSLSQAGVPLGSALDAHPSEFNQVVQKIKRFK